MHGLERWIYMDNELIDTLQFIIDQYRVSTQGSVFILMCEFPWYNERNRDFVY